MQGMPDLHCGSTFSKAREVAWSLSRTANRKVMLPYRDLSVECGLSTPLVQNTIALVTPWTWAFLSTLAKYPTKEQGGILQEEECTDPHP